jgi:hypothetical protein
MISAIRRAAAVVAFGVVGTVVTACGSDVVAPKVANGGSALLAPGGNGGNGGNQTTPTPPAPAPVLSFTQSVVGSSVTVSWTPIAGCSQTAYWPKISNGTSTFQIGNGNDLYTATSYTFTNVPNGTYTVSVAYRRNDSNSDGCSDNGWNHSADQSATVNVAATVADATAPVITAIVSPPAPNGSNGWYTSSVTLSWSVVDNESAVTSAPCTGATITADQQATTYTCSATSAGGTSSQSVTIKKDGTGPVVTFGGSMSYTIDQTVAISCSATDATSGVASSICPSASGAAYTFQQSNTLSASATDVAGNTTPASATFTVTATYGSLCNLVKLFVSHNGIANSLCVKLNAAAASAERGNMTSKANQLDSFRKEVAAQTGKNITAANATILLYWVGTL